MVVATLWGYTSGDYAAAGNAVVLKLAAGDTVKVLSRESRSVNLYGTGSEIYTTFTGVQLGSNSLEGMQFRTYQKKLFLSPLYLAKYFWINLQSVVCMCFLSVVSEYFRKDNFKIKCVFLNAA